MKRNRFYVSPLFLYLILSVFCGFLLASCSKKGPASDSPSIDTGTIASTIKYIDTLADNVPMKHVGGMHTADDFQRIKSMLASNTEPWVSGWNVLLNDGHSQLTYTPHPTTKLIRGGNSIWEPDPDNYGNAYNDVAAAYEMALRWKISGDVSYAQKAISILNAWATTCTKVSGDPNAALAVGIYGYQFAITGELLRDYSGWQSADFQAYQNWTVNVFGKVAQNFLIKHQGSCWQHYWSNWDLCNLAAEMSVGILADNRALYNHALYYLQHGQGNGNMTLAINHVFTGKDSTLAQLQESGRDQGHATLVISLLGPILQLAYNQGDDLFAFDNNLFLKGCEYIAKYNVANLDVPFFSFNYYDCNSNILLTSVGFGSRGANRPMWALPYYHYTAIKHLNAPYSKFGVQSQSPEGWGGGDCLGFGTLMFTR